MAIDLKAEVSLESIKALFSGFKLPGLKGMGKRKGTLGVDPGSWSLKVVTAANAAAPFDIQTCIMSVRSEDAAEETVKEAIANGGYLKTRAAFSLADEKIENHEFKLPKLAKKELDTAIEWEIKKAVASPDYVYHDVLTYETEAGFDVQCVVAAKDIVKNRFEEGKLLGVQPTFLETESSALLACASAMRPGKPLDRAVIIDLGYSTFRLIFIHKGRISFTRSLYFGLATLSHQVAGQVGAMPHEVQQRLHDLSPETPADPANPMMSVLERNFQELLYTLCEEFRRSEFFTRDQKGLEEISEILLCGGGACLPFAVDYLKKHLSEKTLGVLNPFEGAKHLPEGIEVGSGPLWACALGLSLRNA